jgi:hypothetical protein
MRGPPEPARQVTSHTPLPRVWCAASHARHSSIEPGCTRSSSMQTIYHGRGRVSRKNPPVGPSAGSVAAQTTPVALSSTGRAPMASAPG